MGPRDAQTWIVVELNHLGETKVVEGTLEKALRSDLGVDASFPIFIPVAKYPKGQRTITLHLMEGYVFVGSGLPDTTYFALERRPYVNTIISTPGKMRTLNAVPNNKIEELRTQLRKMVAADIQDGEQIRVTNGSYRNLEGQVLSIVGESAVIQIKLRSLELVVTIPVVFLEVVLAEKAEKTA